MTGRVAMVSLDEAKALGESFGTPGPNCCAFFGSISLARPLR